MRATSQIGRVGAGFRLVVNGRESEPMEEISGLAARAEEVFATHADLRDWLFCVLHRRLHGLSERPSGRCPKVAAAACAIRFKGECPTSSTPREFRRGHELSSNLPARSPTEARTGRRKIQLDSPHQRPSAQIRGAIWEMRAWRYPCGTTVGRRRCLSGPIMPADEVGL